MLLNISLLYCYF